MERYIIKYQLTRTFKLDDRSYNSSIYASTPSEAAQKFEDRYPHARVYRVLLSNGGIVYFENTRRSLMNKDIHAITNQSF